MLKLVTLNAGTIVKLNGIPVRLNADTVVVIEDRNINAIKFVPPDSDRTDMREKKPVDVMSKSDAVEAYDRCHARTPVFGRCFLESAHAGDHVNSMGDLFREVE